MPKNQILINRCVIIGDAPDTMLVNRPSAVEALAVYNEWKKRWGHKKDLVISFHHVVFHNAESFYLADLSLEETKALAMKELAS